MTEQDSQPGCERQVETDGEKTSNKLYSGQQCITTYFKSTKRLENGLENGMESAKMDSGNNENWKTSDIVTSEEGKKRLIMLGSDVVALFPNMKEINTGRAVSNQIRKSPLKIRGVD